MTSFRRHSTNRGEPGGLFGWVPLLAGALAVLSAGSPVRSGVVHDLATDQDSARLVADQVLEGASRVTSCDVNADGIHDLIVGNTGGDGPIEGREQAGEVYVVYGERRAWSGQVTLASVRDQVIYGARAGDQLGGGLACGDIDRDGAVDLALVAIWEDGPFDARFDVGVTHVLFGIGSRPTAVDLISDPSDVLLIGDINGSATGERSVTIADITGDGYPEVMLGAWRAYGGSPTKTRAGRAYMLFGRSTWPASIDLRNQADVTFLGRSSYDGLGSALAAADMNLDGTQELLIGAHGGDAPIAGRADTGEVAGFRGRESWPLVINLAMGAPDYRFFGSDTGDGFGASEGLATGDVDGDGRMDLLVAVSSGDGPDNSIPEAGELVRFEASASLPSQIDARSQAVSTLYGVESTDSAGAGVSVGDLDGDGTMDVGASISYGDGPSNSRTDCGEPVVFRGRTAFPATANMSAEEVDYLVYGHRAAAGHSLRILIDINDDGLAEMATTSFLGHDTILSTIWLTSPFDTDGDGITQLPDNCPLVANANQLDSDGDRRGDACALDWDGDGLVDGEDCAPNKASGGKPPAITGLGFGVATKTRLTWVATPLASSFDVSRGTLPRLAGDDYGACQNARDTSLTDTEFTDTDLPFAGTGFFYLVRGRNAVCPATGSWGTTSSGAERVNGNVVGCP